MITYKDLQVEGSTYEISLLKLTGKKVKDIRGYLADPYDAGASFQLTKIVFDDDTTVDVEGEHDFPYITSTEEQPNFDEDTLSRLMDEQDDE